MQTIFVVGILVDGFMWFASPERGESGRIMATNDLYSAKRYTNRGAASMAARSLHGTVMTTECAKDHIGAEQPLAARIIARCFPESRRGMAEIGWRFIDDASAIGSGYYYVEYRDINNNVINLDTEFATHQEASIHMNDRYPNRIKFGPNSIWYLHWTDTDAPDIEYADTSV